MEAKKSPDEVIHEALNSVASYTGETVISRTITVVDARGQDRAVDAQ